MPASSTGTFDESAQRLGVSVAAPLGTAILGRGKGDTVQVESPNGSMSYVIVDFERLSEIPPGQITPPPPLIA